MLKSSQCIGMSQLRCMRADKLEAMTDPLVVFSHSLPVAALVPYGLYLKWQDVLAASERLTEVVARAARTGEGERPTETEER